MEISTNLTDSTAIASKFGSAKLSWINACQYRLDLAKIAEEMHYCISAHHDCSLVNVYDRIIGGVNDPYGVKVI